MKSALNPEAPEFQPGLKSAIQDGYGKVKESVKTVHTFPSGYSNLLFQSYPEFRTVTDRMRANANFQSRQIMYGDAPPSKMILDGWSDEENWEKITDVNDTVFDRININLDTLLGVNKPSEQFINGVSVWNQSPVIARIKVGSTTLVGAKNIPRPQLNFKDHIDNSDSLWVPKIVDKPNNIKPLALKMVYNDEGQPIGYENPYHTELMSYKPPKFALEVEKEEEPLPPPPDETPLTMVDSPEKLDELVKHLGTVREFAVDLEHHSFRTYQGIACLMQITTAECGDYIVDALALREHMHKLNSSFTNPNIIKVFHGALNDVLWLQRDFGVYVVGLFDTYQAARLLQLPYKSLKYLLMRYCQIETDKKYQMADWRIRPLPDEFIQYARLDTHYLLYIWRRMKRELADHPHLLNACFKESADTCLATYKKETLTDTSHMFMYMKSKKSFNAQQMTALKALYRWRDEQARELDESTMYLLPNHMLLSLAETLPREVQGVIACCNPTPPFLKQHVLTVHRIILSCRELPIEPRAVYQTRASVPTPAVPRHDPARTMHDLTTAENSVEGIADPSRIKGSEAEIVTFDHPQQLKLFKGKYEELGTDRTSGGVVSELNVDAQLFVPPHDRHWTYCSVKQAEDFEAMKLKEARVSAIGGRDPLIREEVLAGLQKSTAAAEPEPSASAACKEDSKNFQRKRKTDKSEFREGQECPSTSSASATPDGPRPKTINRKDNFRSQYNNPRMKVKKP